MVNGKKLRRLMPEYDLQPKQRRRYVVTTDSDHAGLIYPDLAKDVVPNHPNQFWVAGLFAADARPSLALAHRRVALDPRFVAAIQGGASPQRRGGGRPCGYPIVGALRQLVGRGPAARPASAVRR